MTLAQQVRDYRYAKGWGPDELAVRASISRTALYQIESGKTENPRAATLRRIAEALGVATESFLGNGGLGMVSIPSESRVEESCSVGQGAASLESLEDVEAFRFNPMTQGRFANGATWMINHRERDLERKFRELLRTPYGESLARIVEESYRLVPRRTEAVH